jgi:hypothetical protein
MALTQKTFWEPICDHCGKEFGRGFETAKEAIEQCTLTGWSAIEVFTSVQCSECVIKSRNKSAQLLVELAKQREEREQKLNERRRDAGLPPVTLDG